MASLSATDSARTYRLPEYASAEDRRLDLRLHPAAKALSFSPDRR
ncbi:hypothetical protein RHECNPAF_64200119 [Rhizobium etli CNPAF512]|nr:hypothetical protein RHECNPAF_64200119 [Rhizobium etli CNPAF512]